MDFKTVEQTIRPLLSKSMELRADDMALYIAYLKANGVPTIYDAVEFFTDRKRRLSVGLASYEAVSRARRKLQEINPNLRPSKKYIEGKKAAEAEYREYARRFKKAGKGGNKN